MLQRTTAGKTLVWDIVVPPRRRQVTSEQIQAMRHSLRENGLITPIGIRIADEMEVNGEMVKAVPVLVYGATRLEAAKQEGWREIDTQLLEGTDRDFAKAEIIENLHRTELTVQERADWTAELVRLCSDEKVAHVEPPKGGKQPLDQGVRNAARELGEDRNVIQRAVKIAAIAPEAKEAAKAAKLDDNQSALLQVAAEPTAEAQVAKVQEIAERRRQSHPTTPQTDPPYSAQAFATWLLERVKKPADRETLVEYVKTVDPRDLLWALKRAVLCTSPGGRV